MRWTNMIVFFVGIGAAAADPLPAAQTVAQSDPLPLFSSQPQLRAPSVNLTIRDVPSLRLEAVRVAGERFSQDWRYPEPGPTVGWDGKGWFIGTGHYRPRSRRAAALHGGSIAATIAGEILLQSDSPLAGVGALVTGATLDAAAADADRDAEAARGH